MTQTRNLIGVVVALLVLAGAAWLLSSTYGGKSPGTRQALTFASSLLPTPAAASPSPAATATAGTTAPPPSASPGPTTTPAITATAAPTSTSAITATVAPTGTASVVYRAEAMRIVSLKQFTHDGHSRYPPDIAWSPDGTRLVYPIPNGRLITGTVDGGRAVAVLNQLWLYDLKTGGSQKLADNGEVPKWSSDGRYLLFGAPTDTEHDSLEVLDLAARGVTQVATGARLYYDWLGPGRLVGAGGDLRPFSVGRQGGVPNALTVARPLQADKPLAFAVSPNGRWIATVDSRGLWLAPVDRLDQQTRLSDTFGNVLGGLAWSPQSDKLAYNQGSMQGGSLSWTLEVDTLPGPSRPQAVYRGNGPGLYAADISWSPDGNVLAFDGQVPSERQAGVMVVDADGATQPRFLLPSAIGSDATPFGAHWSPDGSAMALEIGADEGKSNLWLAALTLTAEGEVQ